MEEKETTWTVDVKLPNFQSAKVNNVTRLEGDSWSTEDNYTNNRFIDYVKNQVSKVNLEITNKEEEEKNVEKFLYEWYQRFKQSQEKVKEVNFFTLFEPDETDSYAAQMSYRLKKPINKLTGEEKEFLRGFFTELGKEDFAIEILQ